MDALEQRRERLQAEIATVQEMLDGCDDRDAIEKASWEGRLTELKDELESMRLSLPELPPALQPHQCPHARFEVAGQVARLVDDDGVPEAFRVDVHVACADCGVPFRFFGMPTGLDISKPMMSLDGTEARLPMRPLDGEQRLDS